MKPIRCFMLGTAGLVLAGIPVKTFPEPVLLMPEGIDFRVRAQYHYPRAQDVGIIHQAVFREGVLQELDFDKNSMSTDVIVLLARQPVEPGGRVTYTPIGHNHQDRYSVLAMPGAPGANERLVLLRPGAEISVTVLMRNAVIHKRTVLTWQQGRLQQWARPLET